MPDNKIEWLPEATQDIYRLKLFLKNKYPAAAKNAGQRILNAVHILIKNPEVGMPCQDEGCEAFKDLFTSFGKGGYTIRYLLEQHNILIVRVWHSR